MNLTDVSSIDIDNLVITGTRFLTIKNKDGTDCYVRIQNSVCPKGLQIQEFDGKPKAYITLVCEDTTVFDNLNNWVTEMAADKFSCTDVIPIGKDNMVKLKVELKGDGSVDAAVFDAEKNVGGAELLSPGSTIATICQVRGIWCMNGAVSVTLRAVQMRVWPPCTTSASACMIDTDDDEEDGYVPFKSNEKSSSVCLIQDE